MAHGALRPVSGQIDRLAVTGREVLIADFKSERIVPATPPDAYVAQLALYRAVIRNIYPNHIVRAALVWTQISRLDEIPAEQLDSALISLAVAAP